MALLAPLQQWGLSASMLRQWLSFLFEASISVPGLVYFKNDEIHTRLGRVIFGVWVTACVLTSLRAVLVIHSSSASQRGCYGTNNGAERLSSFLAYCYLTGGLVSTIFLHMPLATWCFFVGVANVTLVWNLRKPISPPLQATSVDVGSSLERDHYTQKWHRWGTTCAICLEDFKEGDQVARLACGHIFHERCVVCWLQQRTQCPYRCSTSAVSKWEQWGAQELADEAVEVTENEEHLAIGQNMLCSTDAGSEACLHLPWRSTASTVV